MGMSVGSSSGREPEPMVEMNTTPLIDVMLVLLIMLIVTIPVQLHSINMNMPPPNVVKPPVEPEVIKIDIDAQSRIYWNGELLADRDTLVARLSAASKKEVQPEVHIRPDKNANYGVVAFVMASSQRLGLVKMGILGHEQFL
ncbi:MAG: biopolymer transporter ExbD [Casimicrobiaceae bacterium]|nr:biopolymer transporter ExbD [Casimicrobiaceae bacterium]MCX8099325.1 biopolymer transporter ExbD [Casimicrobiaceae bacterium]MDW8312328.1 biopolymer transporter ExbD [Burkholderiales bacterium]